MEDESSLNMRQQAQYEALEVIAEHYGLWTQDAGADGAHYMSQDQNPFIDEGLICANCVFYEGGQRCEIVEGRVSPMGLCKLWIIESELLAEGMHKASYTPPEGVRTAAKRALGWIADGKAGDGFTATGKYRAETLAAGDSVSLDTIRRMSSFFARHEVDKKAEGFSQGEKGYPSPGRVAWDAWGGDAGWSWAKSIVSELEKAQRFGSRSAAGQYAAQVRWSRRAVAPADPPERVVERLKHGEAVTISRHSVPALTEVLLTSEPVNLRNLTVLGTPFFAGDDAKMERSEMPQAPSTKKEQFLAEIESQGLTVERATVSPATLKPVQADVNSKSSAEIMQRENARGSDAFIVGDNLAVVVSSDGYVIDGHHRWAGAALRELGGQPTSMSVIRIGAPRDALIGVMREWNDKEGVKPLGFLEQRRPPSVNKALAFRKAIDLALKAQKEYANGIG